MKTHIKRAWLLFVVFLFCCASICSAQSRPADNPSPPSPPTTAPAPQQERNRPAEVNSAFQDRPVHLLSIANATNGGIPFRVFFNDDQKNYQDAVESGKSKEIVYDEDCQLQIPGGKWSLKKDNSYVIFFDDQTGKLKLRLRRSDE